MTIYVLRGFYLAALSQEVTFASTKTSDVQMYAVRPQDPNFSFYIIIAVMIINLRNKIKQTLQLQEHNQHQSF